jgi:hypothetical protein
MMGPSALTVCWLRGRKPLKMVKLLTMNVRYYGMRTRREVNERPNQCGLYSRTLWGFPSRSGLIFRPAYQFVDDTAIPPQKMTTCRMSSASKFLPWSVRILRVVSNQRLSLRYRFHVMCVLFPCDEEQTCNFLLIKLLAHWHYTARNY